MSKMTWTWMLAGCVAIGLFACSSDGGDDDSDDPEQKADSGPPSGFDGSIPTTGGGSEARCVFPADQLQCTDWRGNRSPSWMVQEGVCSSAQGTFGKDQTCDPKDRLGGCQATLGDGSKQTNWFYKGTKYADAAAVEAKCDKDDGEVFVTQ